MVRILVWIIPPAAWAPPNFALQIAGFNLNFPDFNITFLWLKTEFFTILPLTAIAFLIATLFKGKKYFPTSILVAACSKVCQRRGSSSKALEMKSCQTTIPKEFSVRIFRGIFAPPLYVCSSISYILSFMRSNSTIRFCVQWDEADLHKSWELAETILIYAS